MNTISVAMLVLLNLVPFSLAGDGDAEGSPCAGTKLQLHDPLPGIELPGLGDFSWDDLKSLGLEDDAGVADVSWSRDAGPDGDDCELVLYAGPDFSGASFTYMARDHYNYEGLKYKTLPKPEMLNAGFTRSEHKEADGMMIRSLKLRIHKPLSCKGDEGASNRFDILMCTSHMCSKCAMAWCVEKCQKVQKDFPTCRCPAWPDSRKSYSGGKFAGKGKFGDAGDYSKENFNEKEF